FFDIPDTWTTCGPTLSLSVTVDLCNGIIFGNNPLNFRDAFGLCKNRSFGDRVADLFEDIYNTCESWDKQNREAEAHYNDMYREWYWDPDHGEAFYYFHSPEFRRGRAATITAVSLAVGLYRYHAALNRAQQTVPTSANPGSSGIDNVSQATIKGHATDGSPYWAPSDVPAGTLVAPVYDKSGALVGYSVIGEVNPHVAGGAMDLINQ
ncbi:MAG: hypothetical protein JXR37_20035, partial [Kiritimatiellae bacterium]|nr:hypothetical protein [Kiritimatiellia bacterium]